MTEPFEFFVAPNVQQPLQVPVHRLRLGHEGFEAYPHGSLGAGYFAFWIPVKTGGRVTVEVESKDHAQLQIWRGTTEVTKGTGNSLSFEVPKGEMGRWDLHVRPQGRAVRVSFVVEGWPEDEGKPLVPWNFWYFPYSPEPESDPKKFNSRETQLSAMRKFDRISVQQPGQALAWEELHHGDIQQLDKDGKPEKIVRREGWEGHCDPAAFASVYFNAPPASVTLKGETFDRNELGLLASEWAGRRLTLDDAPSWYQGKGRPEGPLLRYVERTDAGETLEHQAFVTNLLRPGEEATVELLRDRFLAALPSPHSESRTAKVTEQARTAAPPEGVRQAWSDVAWSFWTFIESSILARRLPAVLDVGPDVGPPHHVWNHALVLVRGTVRERPGAAGHPADPRNVLLVIDLFTNLDDHPVSSSPSEQAREKAHLPPADVVGGRSVPRLGCHQRHRYELDLELSTSGSPNGPARWFGAHRLSVGGTETLVYAPRTAAVPIKPVPQADAHKPRPEPGNPWIRDEIHALMALRRRFQ